MAVVSIRELKADASALTLRAEDGEPIFISRRGRPIAVMLPLDMKLTELLWANSSGLARRHAEALRSLAAGEYVPIEDLDEAMSDRQEMDQAQVDLPLRPQSPHR